MKSGVQKTNANAAKTPRKRTKKERYTAETRLFLKTFGNRVRELREKEGMSQDQLGYECGIDRTTVLRMEKGHYETGISSMFLIAKALNVPLQELLNFEK